MRPLIHQGAARTPPGVPTACVLAGDLTGVEGLAMRPSACVCAGAATTGKAGAATAAGTGAKGGAGGTTGAG